ncbi:MAG: metallopeptidase [Candidatus Blackburnbacteria bacterium]|nr:metallopeptidase [Candidatus Blackburnbacteria bacterium]
MRGQTKKRAKLEWQRSAGLSARIGHLTGACGLDYIRVNRIFCYESTGAKTRAYARIWGLNRIWQSTLEVEPAYILEVISEKFNRLSPVEKDHVLIHELLHIPKNFSGALVPHKRKGGVNEKKVKLLYQQAFLNK